MEPKIHPKASQENTSEILQLPKDLNGKIKQSSLINPKECHHAHQGPKSKEIKHKKLHKHYLLVKENFF
jgi:hypothetical protein